MKDFVYNPKETPRENFKRDLMTNMKSYFEFIEFDFKSTTKSGCFDNRSIEDMYVGWSMAHRFFGREYP